MAGNDSIPDIHEELRILPRFPLPKEQIKFFFDDQERVFSIRDLSLGGVGISLLEHSEILLFPLGNACLAEMKMDGEIFQVRLVVRRISAWSIGLQFDSLPKETEAKIKAFLSPMHIGQSMKRVPLEGGMPSFAAGVSGWYHGDSSTDLYFWHNSRGGVGKSLLCMNTSFWEWSEQYGSRTGKFERLEGDNVEFFYDPQPEKEILDMARGILVHTKALDYRLLNFLKDQI